MTMAFAFVSLTAVNLGVVMRREREAPWSSPLFPYFALDYPRMRSSLWAAVGLSMFQRLLDTVALSGGQWLVVMGLSVVTPALVAIDKGIQLHRRAKTDVLVKHAP